MNVTEIWTSSDKPTISFELFPPKSAKAAENLEATIDELAAFKPAFFSVTFGAGGSTREGSYQLVEKLKIEKGQEVIAYFAGYGLGHEDITAVLDSYKQLGITNLLAVRGDPPKEMEDFTPHPESFEHASGLIEFIRSQYDFCMGAAGYPEGHIECESREKDLEYLNLKVANGAEYIICNYFYDNRYFFDFKARCEAIGITVPILPGVMPIYSIKMMEMLAGLCGATITAPLREGLATVPEGDTKALGDFGVQFAVNQCKGLLEAGVPGLHFYTMNRRTSAANIIKRLKDDGFL